MDLFCEIDLSLAEFFSYEKGPKYTIRTDQQGIVQMCSIGAIVIRIIFVHPRGHVFLTEPIRFVRRKCKHWGKTVHSVLVRG